MAAQPTQRTPTPQALARQEGVNVARWKRDERLLRLLGLLAAGAQPQEIAVPPEVHEALPWLIAEAEDALMPLDDETMAAELTGVVAALGMGLSQPEKREWMTVAAAQLSQFPAALCREGLRDAGTACDSLRQVLKHVRQHCEDYPNRMRRRLERLQQLEAIAEGREF